jgi:hypothetical protein
LISSDDPSLTLRLLDHVPDNVGAVFKVAGDGDGSATAFCFAVRQTAEFWSFTSGAPFDRDADVNLTPARGGSLASRRLTPRYQLDRNDTPSIRPPNRSGCSDF